MTIMKPGETKNPTGRPKGQPDKRDIYNCIKADLPAILEVLVKQAKGGDAQAARILLDRSVPVLRATDVHVALPVAGGTPVERAQSVLDAVEAGTVTQAEATTAMQLISSAAQIATNTELLQRVAALEEHLASIPLAVSRPEIVHDGAVLVEAQPTAPLNGLPVGVPCGTATPVATTTPTPHTLKGTS